MRFALAIFGSSACTIPLRPLRGETGIGSKEVRRADVVYTSIDEERKSTWIR